jgi:hypothetical protein
MMSYNRLVEHAVRIMSSTYSEIYEVVVGVCKMNNEESTLEAWKPMDKRNVLKRTNHVQGACFKP